MNIRGYEQRYAPIPTNYPLATSHQRDNYIWSIPSMTFSLSAALVYLDTPLPTDSDVVKTLAIDILPLICLSLIDNFFVDSYVQQVHKNRPCPFQYFYFLI